MVPIFYFDPVLLLLLALEPLLYFILIYLAAKVAPKVQSKFGEKLTLGAAMVITAAAIVIISGVTIYFLLSFLANSPAAGLILGLTLFSVLGTIAVQYLFGPYFIQLAYGLQEAPKDLYELVNSLAQEAGLKPGIKVYVYPGEPNAFAFGNLLTGKRVAISTKLLEIMDPEELRAVIGHELGHHAHRDVALILGLSLLPSIVYNLSYWLLMQAMFGGYWSRDRRESEAGLYEMLLGLLGIAISFLVQILVLAFSRLREYYADRFGARLAGVGNMQAALARLHAYYQSYTPAYASIASSSIKQLFIYALVDALIDKTVDEKEILIEKARNAKYNPLTEIFSTHPPISKRIKALDRLRERS